MKALGYAPNAIVDLEEIIDHIALDDPARALTFVAELEAKAAQTAERPKSFRSREELGPGIRSAVHGSYIIFFRELDTEVRIVHVVHGRRDLRKLTFD